jgi:hypothetical protein
MRDGTLARRSIVSPQPRPQAAYVARRDRTQQLIILVRDGERPKL